MPNDRERFDALRQGINGSAEAGYVAIRVADLRWLLDRVQPQATEPISDAPQEVSMSQSTTEAAIWTDPQGRPWSTAINVNAIRRAKDLAGVNLLEVFDGKLLSQLADDPLLLVNTLYAVCKPQADERNVTDESFGELLLGDTIELAAAALVRGITDFFPQDRRAVLQRLWAATSRTRSEAIRLATDKLDSPLVEQAIQGAMQKASHEIDQRLRSFGDSSGSSPESSALTPGP